MPRRAQKNSSHTTLYLLIIAIAVIAVIIGKNTLNRRAAHFKNTPELPIQDYQNNANNLSGNTYRTTGKITEKLKWTASLGQTISILVEQDNTTANIPVIIPTATADNSDINLERGQQYTFKVTINKTGLPIAQDIKAQ